MNFIKEEQNLPLDDINNQKTSREIQAIIGKIAEISKSLEKKEVYVMVNPWISFLTTLLIFKENVFLNLKGKLFFLPSSSFEKKIKEIPKEQLEILFQIMQDERTESCTRERRKKFVDN